MCRRAKSALEFFLIHPGGPFWAHKNVGAWSIPKGLVEKDESMLKAAEREFFEETGIVPTPPYHDLGSLKTKGGKTLYAWTFEGNWDPSNGIESNQIKIEFPYRSGKFIEIPEADKAEWMNFEKASTMINTSQQPFLERCLSVYQMK